MKTTNITRITFRVNDEGKIEVKKIESINEEAENFVKKKISNTPCKATVYPYDQLNKIKFRIDLN